MGMRQRASHPPRQCSSSTSLIDARGGRGREERVPLEKMGLDVSVVEWWVVVRAKLVVSVL